LPITFGNPGGPMSDKRLNEISVLLSMLDNLPTPVFLKDDRLRYVYSNTKNDELLGRSESILLGKTDADFFEASEAEGFLELDRNALSSDTEIKTEHSIKLPDGSTAQFLTRKAKLTLQDGKSYILGNTADISDVKRKEDQFRFLADEIPVGVVHVKKSGNVVFANALALQYLGSFTLPTSVADIKQILGCLDENFPGQKMRLEADIRRRGQSPLRLMIKSSGWKTNAAHNDTPTAIITLVDLSEISELRQINDEISRLNTELAENMRKLSEAQDELIRRGRMEQLGQLTATVAHELRNPLGAVRTSAFLLERKVKGKELGVEPQLERIASGVMRCDDIITQLLDFSRSKKLDTVPGDLDDWLQGVLTDEGKKLPPEVTLTVDLGLDGHKVPFDGGRLERAVINLVSNAVEAFMVGGKEGKKIKPGSLPEVTVTTRRNTEHAFITVTDNGPGIPPEVMARIREPLFTTKSFGTGLGVPAIEQIAHQHGGTLDIESAPGSGARFTLSLPLQTSAVQAA
jgi:PAS domain S-box-containing protein